MTYTVYDDTITINLIQEACKVLGEYVGNLDWFECLWTVYGYIMSVNSHCAW